MAASPQPPPFHIPPPSQKVLARVPLPTNKGHLQMEVVIELAFKAFYNSRDTSTLSNDKSGFSPNTKYFLIALSVFTLSRVSLPWPSLVEMTFIIFLGGVCWFINRPCKQNLQGGAVPADSGRWERSEKRAGITFISSVCLIMNERLLIEL